MAEARRLDVMAVLLGTLLMVSTGCSGSQVSQLQTWSLHTVPSADQAEVQRVEREKQRASRAAVDSDAKIQDAERELAQAHDVETAAKLREDAQQNMLKAEKLTGQPASIKREAEQLTMAQKALEAAQARVLWCRAKVAAAKAHKRCEQGKLQHANAELDYQIYRALKNQGDPRVQTYSDQELVDSASDAKRQADASCREWDEKTVKVREALARWEQLRGAIPTSNLSGGITY